MTDDQSIEAKLARRIAALTLEEKVQLLTGRDFWTTWPMEKIGLRRILVSDGPSGVRGEQWDERSPSLNMPSASALSSSWDPVVAANYGAMSAIEARRKGVDVVLGPTINLHRSPLGGRHFEAFSEDPLLTANLAAAYVAGVQRNGVGATPKHYIANDSETDRFTVDVDVDERTLRELSLRAFEDTITRSNAWLVMSAYNSINGTTATENDLLESPLNDEWGFDGVVISDWTAVRSLASAEAAQDLVMPGPEGPWGAALVEAVRRGEIAEAVVDRKALRILHLAARVGALEGFDELAIGLVDDLDGLEFAREAAVEGSVLVHNSGILPFESPSSIAVIGHNALHARTQGGGSATVIPEHVVSPLEGIRATFSNADVTYSLGCIVQEGLIELPQDAMTNPVTGERGARVELRDERGAVIFTEDRRATGLVYFGGDAPISDTRRFDFETEYTPTESGSMRVGFASVGSGKIIVDGVLLLEASTSSENIDLGAAFLAPPTVSTPVTFEAGVSRHIRIEFEPELLPGGLRNAMSITIGTEPDVSDHQSLTNAAAAAAARADVAVVVVGTNSAVESEGFDRSTLALPGRQDDLVRAVIAANPRTAVIVNSGSPVIMPWRDDAAAVILTYFGGQEYGSAVAAMLAGSREPGGRLPTTWPAATEDVPVIDVTPVNGVLRYHEGIHIGYRAWLRADRRPAYPFGFGLGYTTWQLTDASIDSLIDGNAEITVGVSNTGARAGKHVVQVYAERPDSIVDRPVRWLVAHAVVRLDAGESALVALNVRARDLAYWDAGWQLEAGEFTLRIGSSVVDLPLAVNVTL